MTQDIIHAPDQDEITTIGSFEATSIDEPLAHLTTNSKAAVIHEICKQERVHWFLGLRQAELFIRDKQQALEGNVSSERRLKRRIRSLERDLLKLQHQLNCGEIETEEGNDGIEELRDEIEATNRGWYYMRPLIRDAEMELMAALNEKQRILAEHPEVLEMSFEERQEKLTPEALVQVQAWHMAPRVWAKDSGLPEGVAQMLFECAAFQQEAVMRREIEIREKISLPETVVHFAHQFLGLSEEGQKAVVHAMNVDISQRALQIQS